MIAKGKSVAHTAQSIDYAKEKLKAVEINRNKIIGETGQEIQSEFQIFQKYNSRCEKNTFSFVLSPTIEDGNKMSLQDFKKISHEFLNKMGLSSNQNITFLHQDRSHKHLHIYVNRINEKGVAVKDTYISNKASRIAEEIAQKRGLTLAKDVQKKNILKRQNELKKEIGFIKNANKEILKTHLKNINEYAKKMKEKGIDMKLKHDSKGKLVGVNFLLGEKSIKASDVGRDLSGRKITETIAKNAINLIPDPLTKTLKVTKAIVKTLNKASSI